ncbi:MAG: Peroxisome chaperone and import receptor [Candelina submexicana]|nr:MAG: Peroxisome chaperone and import receptor [Candelina submexicana]
MAAEEGSLKDLSAAETAPDPDEDDLDDLDDLLDEFSSAGLDMRIESPGKFELPHLSSAEQPVPATSLDEAFAEELQTGMSDLIGGLENLPEMQQQFGSLIKELGVASTSMSQDEAPSTSAAEDTFQETIKRTMERMQESGEQAGAAATAESTDDILAHMLKEMQSDELNGSDSEEGFSKMLLGMMEQLTNKEILYEPMKELHEKYPEWMEKNKTTIRAEDRRRYEEQQGLVGEIVGKFEEREYSDSKAVDREFIVERMQKMQAAGSPPADLVGDMNAAQEALGEVGSGCHQQ